jgi:hypothetical protein
MDASFYFPQPYNIAVVVDVKISRKMNAQGKKKWLKKQAATIEKQKNRHICGFSIKELNAC